MLKTGKQGLGLNPNSFWDPRKRAFDIWYISNISHCWFYIPSYRYVSFFQITFHGKYCIFFEQTQMDEVILLLLLYPCWIRISRFRFSPGWRSWFPEKPITISWKTRFSTITQHVFSVKLHQTFKSILSILQSDFYPNWTTYSRLRTEPGRLPGAHASHRKWHSFWTDPTKSVNGGCRELLGNQTGGDLQGNSIILPF